MKLIYNIILIAAFAFIMGSCNDETPDNIKVPEGEVAEVSILIGNDESVWSSVGGRSVDSYETRVVDESKEKGISNLYIVIVSKNMDGSKSVDVRPLNNPKTPDDRPKAQAGYKQYNIVLYPNDYKFYVVANLDRYLANGNTQMAINSESDLYEITSNINPEKQIITGHLPMACLNPLCQNTQGSVSANTDGFITITAGSSVTITADLTFLCAKVRYTILFDAREGGISAGYGNKKIRFDVNESTLPYVVKVGTKFAEEWTPVTAKYITNPNFEGDNSWGGWTHTASEYYNWDNGENFTNVQDVAEQFSKIFDTFQFLNNKEAVPIGKYRLTADGFYRYGNPDAAWEAHINGSEQLLAKLYIGTSEISFPSLYEGEKCGDDTEYKNTHSGDNQTNYPNDIGGASDAINNKQFFNGSTVEYFHKENNILRIGVRKEKKREDDWTAFDNFKLEYKGFEGTDYQQTIPLDRYTFTAGVNEIKDYPSSKTDNRLTLWEESENWNDLPNKAWQGIVYLPENLLTDKDKKSVLTFPYCYNDETVSRGEKTVTLFDSTDNIDEITHGLVRNTMYDVSIKIVNLSDEDNVEVEVRVKPWEYHPEEEVW